MKKMIPTMIFAVIIMAATAYAGEADRTFDKKFKVASGETFYLTTDVGSVSIEGTASNEVSIYAEMRGSPRTLDDFTITAEQTSRGVEVIGKMKRNWFRTSWNMDVHYTVKVPTEYNMYLSTAGGDIEIQMVKGKIKGETSGGNLSLNQVEGQVDLSTSGGNIRVEKTNGDIRMMTSGGNIMIADAKGKVDVSTSGGRIKVLDVEGEVRAETSGGDIDVRVRKSNDGIFVKTSGGDIDISVPKNTAASLDLSTSGGEVECDLPMTISGKISEMRIKGSINGGGNTIYAHTSGGNVHVRSLE